MNSKKLLKQLSFIDKIYCKNNTLPILDCVLFSNRTITYITLDNEIKVLCDYNGPDVLVPYLSLKEFIKNSKDCNIEIIYDKALASVTIKNPISFIKLNSPSIDEFPRYAESKYKQIDTLIKEDIENLVHTSLYSSKENYKPILQCVFLSDNAIVGTDSIKLFFVKRKYPNKLNINYLIKTNIIKLFKGLDVIKVLRDNSGEYSILQFVNENFHLYHRMQEGNFPDYISVIPTEKNYKKLAKITYNTKLMCDIAKSLKNINKGLHQGRFVFSLETKICKVYSCDMDLNKEQVATIPFECEMLEGYLENLGRNELEIAFDLRNIELYLSGCKQLTSEHIFFIPFDTISLKDDTIKEEIEWNYVNKASLINGEYLIMPQKIYNT